MAKFNPNVPMLNQSELSKTGTHILNKDQMQIILAKTPENHIYTRPAKGGGTWRYVTGTYVKKVLNMVFGWGWNFEVVEHKFDLNIKQAYVLGKLTVTAQDRSIVKMQFGRAEIKFKTEWITHKDGKREKITTDQPLDIGNDLKAATTDALKKCAAELGVASDIYGANEFKEVRVIGDNEEDKRDIIQQMLDLDGLRITEEDRMNVERILENEEIESYDKVIKSLNRALPKQTNE